MSQFKAQRVTDFLSGWTTTSHGRVETTVSGNVNFSNKQKFTINSSQYIQDIAPSTTMDVSTTNREGIFPDTQSKQHA